MAAKPTIPHFSLLGAALTFFEGMASLDHSTDSKTMQSKQRSNSNL